jgi:CarD family transcriptional regulator
MPRPRTGSAARAVPSSTRGAVASTSPAKSNGKVNGKRAVKPPARAEARPVVPAPVPVPVAPEPRPEPPRQTRSTEPPPAPPMRMRPSNRPGPPPGIAIQVPPPSPAPNFKVGDKAVHPAHGVGEVTAIEQREIGGTRTTFYILRILDNGMKVLVPTSAATQVGLRAIMSDKQANNILQTMRAREVAVDVQPWSRRFRVYTEMIKSGSAVEIAKVLRDMNRLKFDKDLSFGERRLLDQARSLLLKELAFAKKKTEAEMAEEIRQIFSA